MAIRQFVRIDAEGFVDSWVMGDYKDPITPGLVEINPEDDAADYLLRFYDSETKSFGNKRPEVTDAG